MREVINMMYKRLRDLREQLGYSQKYFADALGVVRSTVSMYESGEREPNAETLIRIAQLLDVPVAFLIGETPFKCWEEIKANRGAFFDSINMVNKEMKLHIIWGIDVEKPESVSDLFLIRFIADTVQDVVFCDGEFQVKMKPDYAFFKDAADAPDPALQVLPSFTLKPRLGRIACGEPIMAEENIEGYDAAPDFVNCDFTLVCEGDSMIEARIRDGDVVYIRAQSTVENGQIAAVRIGEETTLKKFYQNGNTVTLMPANQNYAPLVFVGEQLRDLRILGRAVAFTSMLK